MSPVLRSVPPAAVRPGDPAHLQQLGEPPVAAALDELGRARIRKVLAGWLGEFPTLDAHVALLDSRGAWYAERVLGAWPAHSPDTFFGLVRHVVRTQLPGPAPDPDVEGWLAAGRPHGPLGPVWDEFNALRYPPGWRPPARRRSGQLEGHVARVDRVLRAWPAGHLDGFTLGYVKTEHILERRRIVLPRYDR